MVKLLITNLDMFFFFLDVSLDISDGEMILQIKQFYW